MIASAYGPASDELRIELMTVALNPVAAMGGGTKEHFMEMAKNAAKEYLDGTMRIPPLTLSGGLVSPPLGGGEGMDRGECDVSHPALL
jgi:hypothetical protein